MCAGGIAAWSRAGDGWRRALEVRTAEVSIKGQPRKWRIYRRGLTGRCRSRWAQGPWRRGWPRGCWSPGRNRGAGNGCFLHGFMADHYQLAHAGECCGRPATGRFWWTCGFGESTGDSYTFGFLDATDIKELVDVLQHKGLCGRTLGVYGTSYGAAAAILYAAIDPRVTTVVAVAPFARIRDEVPVFSRSTLGGLGRMFSDAVPMNWPTRFQES